METVLVTKGSTALPLSKTEHFEDVVQKGMYGEVTQVWHHPGHLFVTTDNSSKLFIFDCKPVSHQHVFETNNQDIMKLSQTIVDILMLTENILMMVDKNSNASLFKFGNDSTWSKIDSFILSTKDSVTSEVLSITFLFEEKLLIWCEALEDSTLGLYSCRLCLKSFCNGFESTKGVNRHTTAVFVQNCPPCNVCCLSKAVLFVSTRYREDQVSFYFTVDIPGKQLTLFIGNKQVQTIVNPLEETIDLQEIMTSHLSSLIQSSPGHGDLGVCSDSNTRQVSVLSSSGSLDSFTHLKDPDGWQVKRQKFDLFKIKNELLCVKRQQWFMRGNLLGLFCTRTLILWDLKQQSVRCRHDLTDAVLGVFPSKSTSFHTWILTSKGVFAVQAIEKINPQKSGQSLHHDNGSLQSNIVSLAHLHQAKLDSYNPCSLLELEKLNSLMAETLSSHHSQLSHIVAPYLDLYWHLENISKSLQTRKTVPQVSTGDKPKELFVSKVLYQQCLAGGEDRETRHSTLVWLSQVYPQTLLDLLCQGISLDSEEVIESEVRAWQKLLGMEGGDLMHFEFSCRLLFLLHPVKLFNFVRCAENISEYSIGVSAFVRKKKTLIYYKTAIDCLPETHSSVDPKAAALTKAKLLLASGTETCLEQSLNLLLSHCLWADAVSLVKEQTEGDKVATFLYILVNALAQGQVLSDYVKDLFSIMPSWKSFLLFAEVATEHPDIRQQQLANTAASVFASREGSGDISLSLVKTHLAELIYQMDTHTHK